MEDKYSRMLFKELERWRLKTKTTKKEMAFLLGISYLTYQNWSNRGVTPQGRYKEKLQSLIAFFEANWESYLLKNKKAQAERVRKVEAIKRANLLKKRREENEQSKKRKASR